MPRETIICVKEEGQSSGHASDYIEILSSSAAFNILTMDHRAALSEVKRNQTIRAVIYFSATMRKEAQEMAATTIELHRRMSCSQPKVIIYTALIPEDVVLWLDKKFIDSTKFEEIVNHWNVAKRF